MLITQVSRIAFSAHLTVLTFFTTVRGKTSKISLIRGFSAQNLTNRVLSSFDRFTASYNCMKKNFKKSPISVSSVHKYQKSCSQLTRPFYCFSQLYEQKLQKSQISVSSVHKYHKFCSQLTWPFYGLLQLYEVKLQKSHISLSSVQKYQKSCFQLP